MPFDLFQPVETTRLRLRCVTPQDAEATSALMTQAVSNWLASWALPFTPQMARHRIELAREAASRGNAMPCAIIVKDSGSFAGWITLSRREDNRPRGALGYWLGERYQGRGFAREALAALLRTGFERLDLDVIEAGAQPENTASLAVMRACGMSAAGRRMVHASARARDESCLFHEIHRSTLAMLPVGQEVGASLP